MCLAQLHDGVQGGRTRRQYSGVSGMTPKETPLFQPSSAKRAQSSPGLQSCFPAPHVGPCAQATLPHSRSWGHCPSGVAGHENRWCGACAGDGEAAESWALRFPAALKPALIGCSVSARMLPELTQALGFQPQFSVCMLCARSHWHLSGATLPGFCHHSPKV